MYASEWHASWSHWSGAHSRSTHAGHTGHTSSGVLCLHGHHHELHLLLLHVFTNFWILVDFVLEECCLEIVFIDSMVDLDPVVSDCTDKYWHEHGVSGHLIGVLSLKQIERVVVRCLY